MARMRLFFGKLLDLGEPEQLHHRGHVVGETAAKASFQAECMDAPDVFGCTGASVVDAKP